MRRHSPSERQRSHRPDTITQLQLPITAQLRGIGLRLAVQRLHHPLTLAAQIANRTPEAGLVAVWRQIPATGVVRSALQTDQRFQIGGEACRRARTAEIGTDVVVPPALGDRLPTPGTNAANTIPVW